MTERKSKKKKIGKIEQFDIEIGVMDRYTPNNIYIEITSYVSPIALKDSYDKDTNKFFHTFKKTLQSSLKLYDVQYIDIIYDITLPNKNIAFGKKHKLKLNSYILLKDKNFNIKEINLTSDLIKTFEHTIYNIQNNEYYNFVQK